MNRVQKSMLVIGVLLSLTAIYVTPGAFAATPGASTVCDGIDATGGSCATSGSELNDIVKLAINLLSVIAGIIGVVMLIIAGIKYITSQGDSGQVKSAKSALIYAVVGLVVAALSQTIVRFVLFKTDQIV